MAKKASKDDKKNKGGAPEGNQNALGNTGGRPPFFASAEELQARVDDYFVWVLGESHEETRVKTDKEGNEEEYTISIWDRVPEPITITGLALHLGFADRQSLNDYEAKVEFSFIIKKARLRVENAYEKALYMKSPTGAIFALKNMGWKDKQEHDHTTGGESFNLKDMVRFE
jgi:hypothetical protein